MHTSQSEPLPSEHLSPESPYSFVSGVTERELKGLVMLMSGQQGKESFIKLYSLFGKDLLTLLAMFQGETIKIPALPALERLRNHTAIHIYMTRMLNVYGDEDTAAEVTGKKFKKRAKSILWIYKRVESALGKVKINGTIQISDLGKTHLTGRQPGQREQTPREEVATPV